MNIEHNDYDLKADISGILVFGIQIMIRTAKYYLTELL